MKKHFPRPSNQIESTSQIIPLSLLKQRRNILISKSKAFRSWLLTLSLLKVNLNFLQRRLSSQSFDETIDNGPEQFNES